MAGKTRHDNSRFAPFIPTLELSRPDEELLLRQAHALVSAAVDEYQYYRDGDADWTMWKEVRRLDTIRIFRERQSITKNDIDRDGAALLPKVLAIGNVAGSVEDMMYGAMAMTPMAMLANSKIADEGLNEAKVMATLLAPTPQNPFRTVSAKWFSFSLGSGMCSLRDSSIVESTGIVTLENRERLGFVLRHSVDFNGVPDLQPFGVLRANIASWAIYRESGPGMVQCFVKSFHDLGSRTWRSMGLKSICDRALAMCKYVECAETKKLVRQLNAGRRSLTQCKRARTMGEGECSVCVSPFASTLLGSSAKKCKICEYDVCPHCLEKKTLWIADDESQRVAMRQLRVCSACMKDALLVTSLHSQIDEIVHASHPHHQLKSGFWSCSLTDSDSSDTQI